MHRRFLCKLHLRLGYLDTRIGTSVCYPQSGKDTPGGFRPLRYAGGVHIH